MVEVVREYKRWRLRSKDQFVKYFHLELTMLKKDWFIILCGALMQYIHSIFTNLAYHLQTKLSVEQKFPLYDLGYQLMPLLSEANQSISEIFVFLGFFAPAAILLISIPMFRQNPQQPRYLVIIGKRVLLHLGICLTIRIISFLGTSLPGAAPHCTVNFDQDCLKNNPKSQADCVIPNPDFDPVMDVGEAFARIDLLKGCGDLMFSSHTMYTLTFLLMISKYWYNKFLVPFLICLQIAICFLIVASRKHYTLDVFTAVYCVPMVWFLLDAYFPDLNNKDIGVSVETCRQAYGVDISEDIDYLDSFDSLSESSGAELVNGEGGIKRVGINDESTPYKRERSCDEEQHTV